MDKSRFLPLVPSVESTTPLFSLTSRSFRPRHRTTTLIFVSEPPSCSKSLSFRFVPAVDVATDATDPVGDTGPDLDGGGIAELALKLPGLGPARELEGLGGGRILFTLLFAAGTAARGIPAIFDGLCVIGKTNCARERSTVCCAPAVFEVCFVFDWFIWASGIDL